MTRHALAAALVASLLLACSPEPMKTDRPIPPAVAYEPRIKTQSTYGEDEAKLRAAAAKGDAWSQGRLAYVLHEQGRERFPEAERLVRAAAEAGEVQAQALLGEWLRSGWGVEADEVEAYKWIRMAAEKCYPGAEYDMGVIYFHGMKDVPKDHAESRYWFVRAATHGHPTAMAQGRRMLEPTAFERFEDWSNDVFAEWQAWFMKKYDLKH